MKIHTTNYQNTFIEIAEDCPAKRGEVPPIKGDSKTIPFMQYELIFNSPYKFTSDDVLFEVFAARNCLTKSELQPAREKFFSKEQPCFRTSPLAKRYGWGIHCDKNAKIALIGCYTPKYKVLATDPNFKNTQSDEIR